jgi:DNA (cytosine-5)-methyltransferase 1
MGMRTNKTITPKFGSKIVGGTEKPIGIMTDIENALRPMAESFTPPETKVEAVIHQWVYAIANSHDLFGESRGANKAKIRGKLKSTGLYSNQQEFSRTINKYVHLSFAGDEFTFVDLFAGIGGMRLGFEYAGGRCVFSSEFERNAQITYQSNFGKLPFGDITLISELDIPEHDVLVAGFPCQPFSHAGVSARNAVGQEHGFKCETQGTLFFDIMRIASNSMPKVMLLENVRNIERHDKGHTFSVIRNSIEKLGYDFHYSIIDSSTVVPQRRVRCYMVCIRKDQNIKFEFPGFSGQAIALSTILESCVADKYTISDRLWSGHIKRTERNLARGTGFTAHTANLNKPSNTLVARYGKDGKECLIPQENKNPRLLTPRECARLQGFPEDFKIPGARTPSYKQFGNSVAVPVVKKIAEKIAREVL